MTVKLGINPITWSNDDDPSLGGDIPLETCLEETRKAGFYGTELGGKFPRDTNSLKAVLDKHALSLVSGWYDGRILEKSVDEEFNAVLPHLSLLRDLGCKVVVYADTSRGRHDGIYQPISSRPVLEEHEWEEYAAKVRNLAARMSDFGVQMAFHHHMGTVIETDKEVDRLMDLTDDAVGLLFDSGHCAFSGGEPLALMARHADRVVHVHCKDVRRSVLDQCRHNDKSFMESVLEGIFTVPGDGDLDFIEILKPLSKVGYNGWLVVEAEQDPSKAHPLTYAKKGFAGLLHAAEAAGLNVVMR